MNDNKRKISIVKLSLFIMGISMIFLGITYAFFNTTITGEKKQVITAGNLDLVLEEDENNLTITDALPMYDEVGMIQEPFTFRLVNNSAVSANYIIKLVEIDTGNLAKTDVKYGLTKDGENTIDLVSNIVDGEIDSGIITGRDTIDYELRLWVRDGVTDITQIQGRFLSFRMSVEESQMMEKSPNLVELKLFNDNNLGSNCKTYDDGTDTFLVGQCSNNYVWYSGKLWRVVLKNNETGAVKMITDNAMTVISYNYGSVAFSESYADQWLNQEFLPTLHDPDLYLVENSEWHTANISSSSPSRPTGSTVERTVGLLNLYEYYTVFAKSNNLATYSTNYLNNTVGDEAGINWWLITPNGTYYDTFIQYDGQYGRSASPSDFRYGIRPVVNLKSTVLIESGKGTINNPYILKGDIQKSTNGITLLNTRYSGNYIKFNNELYRIVGSEIVNNELLTKITAVDIPSNLATVTFSLNGYTNFGTQYIKTRFDTYYQELATSNVDAYNMIQPDTTWYLGGVASGSYSSYKRSVCATVDATKSMKECTNKAQTTTATIAIPHVGEMFSSHITRGIKTNFWTLTNYYTSSGEVLYLSNKGILVNQRTVYSNGGRPSMYLKSNVVIASDNTGNGTYEKPYSIELGA